MVRDTFKAENSMSKFLTTFIWICTLWLVFPNKTSSLTRQQWYQNQGRCYYSPAGDTDYADAEEICKKLGAYPVEFGDQTELRYIQSHLDVNTTDQFWVGLEAANHSEFRWNLLQTQPPASMWNSLEPDFSGDCVRLVCPTLYRKLSGDDMTDTECLMADNKCSKNYSVICEKDAGLVPSSNYGFTHVGKLSFPESSWYWMRSSKARSLIECAVACKTQHTSGFCGAFVYDNTEQTDQCVMFSTDGSSYEQSITDELHKQLYIAGPEWRC